METNENENENENEYENQKVDNIIDTDENLKETNQVEKETFIMPTNSIVKDTIIMLIIYSVAFALIFILFYTGLFLASIVLLGLVIFISFALIGDIFGKLKAKHIVKREIKKAVLPNPYIYFRELPVTYGIGISSILLDFNIEENKDVIATILDLCSRNYLNLVQTNKGIKFTKKNSDTSNLLENELYIYNILTKKVKDKFDVQKWKSLCYEDALKLGLVEKRNNIETTEEISEKYSNKKHILTKILALLPPILLFINFLKSDEVNIFTGVMFFALCITAYFICYGILRFFGSIIEAFNMSKKISHNNYLLSHPIRTHKAKEDLNKLYAFAKFLNDFGLFAEKNIAEIKLWNFYLSYAVLFGLTKNIMKTNYKKLLYNDSFEINNINMLNYNNIFKG